MDMPFTVPMLYARKITNEPQMLGGEFGLHDGSNVFVRHVFVVLTAGSIAAVATAGTSSCGLCLGASQTADVVNPPTQFFGDRHFPVALEGQRFAVSVTDASGHFGQANSAPQTSAIAIGTAYNLIKLSNGNHALNSAGTNAPFFNLVEIPHEWNGTIQDANTYNPVVIVEVVPTVIQKI